MRRLAAVGRNQRQCLRPEQQLGLSAGLQAVEAGDCEPRAADVDREAAGGGAVRMLAFRKLASPVKSAT